MTLQQANQSTEPTIKVTDAAAIMGVTPRFLSIALQQGRFPFGTAVKMTRWSYYINRIRFIEYMRGGEMNVGKADNIGL